MLRYLRYVILTVALVTVHHPTLAAAPSQRAVVEHYANLAHAIYSDALTTAEQLQQAIDTLIKEPSPTTQLAAQQAWRTARVPYSQSEVFRFGNSVDDEWALQVNAWLLTKALLIM